MGFTPLMHAVMCEQYESICFLLTQGADPDLSNFIQETPLHQAADNSLLEIARALLSHSGNPNLKTALGETPLHLATFRGDIQMVEELLKCGADPGLTNTHLSRSPLHYAVEYEHIECCLALLKYNADLHMEDAEGNTPESLATERVTQLLSEGRTETVVTVVHEDSEDFSEGLSIDEFNKSLERASCTLEHKEPDSESHTLNKSQLREFLLECKLEQYTEALVKAGFDDVQAMITQMSTPIPLCIELLQKIGIEKIGHTKRLLMKLEEPGLYLLSYGGTTPLNQSCCISKRSPDISLCSEESTLYEWLADLKLDDLHGAFVASGYDDIEMLRAHMRSRYPLTDQVLRDELGVRKPGYRIRILGKLHGELRNRRKQELLIDNSSTLKSCNKCSVF